MQVLQEHNALLCNHEVLALLEGLKEKQRQERSQNPKAQFPENLQTVSHESLLEALKKYSLTKAEKLQIINLRPKGRVELHYIIEEAEDRGLMEKLDDILHLVATHLPRDDDMMDSSLETAAQPKIPRRKVTRIIKMKVSVRAKTIVSGGSYKGIIPKVGLLHQENQSKTLHRVIRTRDWYECGKVFAADFKGRRVSGSLATGYVLYCLKQRHTSGSYS
ncbi:hypothetical protein G9A89_011749 [Geosiphon pyriformis]|nr:hypothetical protein G9A89_011749 [Geosiphon pyriformis]